MEEESEAPHLSVTPKGAFYAGDTEAQLHYDNAPPLGLVTVTSQSGGLCVCVCVCAVVGITDSNLITD